MTVRALLIPLAVACSTPRAPEASAPSPAAPPATSSVAAPAATAPPSESTPKSVEPEAPTAELLKLERVLDTPVHSLALGKGTRFAALGERASLDDGKGLKQLPPVPKSTENVQIYFGRDDQPRLMGYVRGSGGDESVYLRWRKGAWQRGADEIGKLGGGPPAALFGVLGYDDPEVVCRVGDQCIIKRLTGWKNTAPPPGLPSVVLCGPTPWAFEKDRVHRLDGGGWRSFGEKPPYKQVDGLWAVSNDDVWIAESAAGTLHRFRNGRFDSSAAPVREPRALFARSATDVWLAGQGGVAHFDGKGWTRVRGGPEGLSIVQGRGEHEVWVAGTSGVFRGTRR